MQPIAHVSDESVGRLRAISRYDAPVLHDGDERHASLILLPEELLNVELGIGGERFAQVARDEARDFGGGGPGATSMREIRYTSAPPCSASTAARNSTNPIAIRQ